MMVLEKDELSVLLVFGKIQEESMNGGAFFVF